MYKGVEFMCNENKSCLANVLRAISVLQKNAEKIDSIDNTCTKPFLGNKEIPLCFNTRPITCYLCNNNLLEIEYTEDGRSHTSSVFKVLDVCDNSCVVALLKRNCDETDPYRDYLNTGKTATINLDCICAIRCLPDIVTNDC